MPIAFDRFRLLNGSSRIRNESTKTMYLRREPDDPDPVVVPPGAEDDLPLGPEIILDIEKDELP